MTLQMNDEITFQRSTGTKIKVTPGVVTNLFDDNKQMIVRYIGKDGETQKGFVKKGEFWSDIYTNKRYKIVKK